MELAEQTHKTVSQVAREAIHDYLFAASSHAMMGLSPVSYTITVGTQVIAHSLAAVQSFGPGIGVDHPILRDAPIDWPQPFAQLPYAVRESA
jgi:hypothetical protein